MGLYSSLWTLSSGVRAASLLATASPLALESMLLPSTLSSAKAGNQSGLTAQS